MTSRDLSRAELFDVSSVPSGVPAVGSRAKAGVVWRLGALLVDPWGPSRLRRWLHVTGARSIAGDREGGIVPVSPLDP